MKSKKILLVLAACVTVAISAPCAASYTCPSVEDIHKQYPNGMPVFAQYNAGYATFTMDFAGPNNNIQLISFYSIFNQDGYVMCNYEGLGTPAIIFMHTNINSNKKVVPAGDQTHWISSGATFDPTLECGTNDTKNHVSYCQFDIVPAKAH